MITHAAYLESKMKKKIDGVLVVEGTSDVAFLSSYFEALFFITNGLDVSEEKLDFLSRASKVNKIIVMSDPDEAGQTIENKIKNKINGVFTSKIKKNQRKNYKKSGVAESSIQEVESALKDFVTEDELFNQNYELSTLISLDKNPSEKRQEIANRFGLIIGNNKSLENQLRILKITREELWK